MAQCPHCLKHSGWLDVHSNCQKEYNAGEVTNLRATELEEVTNSFTKPVVVRTYEGKTADVFFEHEANFLAEKGYRIDNRDSDGGHIHAGRLILTGGASILAGRRGIRSKSRTTATYVKQEPVPASPPQVERTEVTSDAASSSLADVTNELTRLADLVERGLLTREEFDRLKAKLLA